ncbi:MAG: Hpt domain-containing protein [Thermodesulfobacteriota bacterium]|nr:Hpt domain-containing protein [Thermodesulfobacteriota bacterium]
MNIKKLAGDLELEEDEYLELLELFIETARADLEALEAAIEEGNADKAAKIAHTLKGASGSLGLMEFFEIVKDIEEKGRDNHLKGTRDSAQTLKLRLDEIVRAVKEL